MSSYEKLQKFLAYKFDVTNIMIFQKGDCVTALSEKTITGQELLDGIKNAEERKSNLDEAIKNMKELIDNGLMS